MGINLQKYMSHLCTLPDATIRDMFPGLDHTADSLKSALSRLEVYPEGMCVVHHMFGQSVTDIVRKDYKDA